MRASLLSVFFLLGAIKAMDSGRGGSASTVIVQQPSHLSAFIEPPTSIDFLQTYKTQIFVQDINIFKQNTIVEYPFDEFANLPAQFGKWRFRLKRQYSPELQNSCLFIYAICEDYCPINEEHWPETIAVRVEGENGFSFVGSGSAVASGHRMSPFMLFPYSELRDGKCATLKLTVQLLFRKHLTDGGGGELEQRSSDSSFRQRIRQSSSAVHRPDFEFIFDKPVLIRGQQISIIRVHSLMLAVESRLRIMYVVILILISIRPSFQKFHASRYKMHTGQVGGFRLVGWCDSLVIYRQN